MNIVKYIERLEYMDSLIRRAATGTPESFAQKVGLSRSALMEYLKALKALGAPIEYDNYIKTYRYVKAGKMKLEFEFSEKDATVNEKKINEKMAVQ
ncbi:hypothetical protein FUAX_20770 [Fulvitalea axinellae]|uniref:HTH domain-containing protein n=1 Tax=Fulvitalea axinellae TaxID=1182444 RepID=A0AAU9DBB8_9BACT|nr:hypothetical protein FUAX_20770 [Fulvitalea axinellae]